jgi:hypothetical protein
MLLTYAWNSGSVPPPHYLEFEVVIDAQGAGRLECRPDYPMNAPPVWRWNFEVPRERADILVRLIAASGSRSRDETANGGPAIGGSAESISVEDDGVIRVVAATPELVQAVRAAVPDEVWADLRARRQQFVEREAGR